MVLMIRKIAKPLKKYIIRSQTIRIFISQKLGDCFISKLQSFTRSFIIQKLCFCFIRKHYYMTRSLIKRQLDTDYTLWVIFCGDEDKAGLVIFEDTDLKGAVATEITDRKCLFTYLRPANWALLAQCRPV